MRVSSGIAAQMSRFQGAGSSNNPGTPLVTGRREPHDPPIQKGTKPFECHLPLFSHLLDTEDFPARWNCGEWDAFHGYLHIVSDVLIWAAYAAIPVALVHFGRRKRTGILFHRIVVLFALFILSCGTVHLIDAIIFYQPVYRISGLMKATTAVVSWVTVIVLWRRFPEAMDLPDLKEANERLQAELTRRRHVETQLAIANDEMRMMASMISHDVRNPLGSAQILARIVEEKTGELSSDEVREHAASVGRSLGAISQILDSFDRNGERPGADEGQVDLNEVLEDVSAALATTISAERGELVWDKMPVVRGRRDHLFHLLVNLVENALKYRGRADLRVLVTSVEDSESITLEVSDNGRGIRPEDREAVFRTGYRSEGSSNREGRGLGLAFCRRIVEHHGGSIRATGNESGGTTFVIRFPRRD